jgi:hypothetical protein
MNFQAGQKVVCVDAGFDNEPGRRWLADPPIEGQVYTVRRVLLVDSYNGREQGVVLDEIKNLPTWGYSYRATRFRPVVERKTDISIFTRMLTPKKQTAHT